MYFLPKELWMIIKEYLLEPKWKKRGRDTFVKQINIINNITLLDSGYSYKFHPSEIMLFNKWNFQQRSSFWKSHCQSMLKLNQLKYKMYLTF
jgi:hypothetical protein